MGWWQVSICCPKDDAPKLSEAFEIADALAVTLQDAGDDPLFEPWPANIRHAGKVGRDYWSAEIQVPLDASQ